MCARVGLQKRPASGIGPGDTEGLSGAEAPRPQVRGGGARARAGMRAPVSGRARDKASGGFAVRGWRTKQDLPQE